MNGKPMEVFREGICLAINYWWEIRCFVGREFGGNLNQLSDSLFQSDQDQIVTLPSSATTKLKELISFYGFDLIYLDNSLQEVSEQLVLMYHECLQRDFTSVQIILEANLRSARILSNELYALPIHYQLATDASITKEVATKLMLMHKECLQGNFSSVEILREESLNQEDKGMLEKIGVAPPAAAVPVVSEKIGVERGKVREERKKWLESEKIVCTGKRRGRRRED